MIGHTVHSSGVKDGPSCPMRDNNWLATLSWEYSHNPPQVFTELYSQSLWYFRRARFTKFVIFSQSNVHKVCDMVTKFVIHSHSLCSQSLWFGHKVCDTFTLFMFTKFVMCSHSLWYVKFIMFLQLDPAELAESSVMTNLSHVSSALSSHLHSKALYWLSILAIIIWWGGSCNICVNQTLSWQRGVSV